MKNLVLALGLIVLFLGCTSSESKEDAITGDTVTKSENFFTRTLETKSENVGLSITENKLTNKSSVNMVYYLNNTIEEDDALCFKPIIIISTVLMRDMIFNDSSIMYAEGSEPLTEFDFRNYNIEKFRVDFIKKETNENLGYIEYYGNTFEGSRYSFKRDYLKGLTNETSAPEMLMECLSSVFESAFSGFN